MSKERLIFQIEEHQKEIATLAARALRYKSAYDYVMEFFKYIPDDKKEEVDKRLKAIGL